MQYIRKNAELNNVTLLLLHSDRDFLRTTKGQLHQSGLIRWLTGWMASDGQLTKNIN